jgi:RimJ/RimL family protein N-acetyltransferase
MRGLQTAWGRMHDRHAPDLDAPELLTERLRLRIPRIDDFAAMSRMWADGEVMRFISGAPSSESESWSRLLRYIGHWQALGFGYWAVEDRASGVFLGEVGLANYKRDIMPTLGDAPEIGWVLTSKAHGRGIATEAAGAVVAWADATLPHEGTVCIFDPAHAASRRVAEKLGYVESHMATYKDRPTLVMRRAKGGKI